MTDLEAMLRAVLTEKEEKLLPKTLKAGVSCLGIEGDYGFEDAPEYTNCNEVAKQILGETDTTKNPLICVENILDLTSENISVDGDTLVIG